MTVLRHPARGFTLIELMVAMAIGTIVLLAAVAFLGRGGDEYQRIGGNVGAEREARALLTQLTEDLRAASFHPDCVFENSAAAWPLDRLGILSLQPADAQSTAGQLADLCAVQYYLKDLTIGGKTVRCLMRGFRESKDTFAALRSGETASLFTPTARDEPLAFGVLSFEARPQSRDESGEWIAWTRNETQGPEAVLVRLVLARREMVAKLTNPGAWDGGGDTSRLLGTSANAANNRNLEVVTARLLFAGGTLRQQAPPVPSP